MRHDLALENDFVRLIPLAHEHADALVAMIDVEMWLWMITPIPDTVDKMHQRIETMFDESQQMGFTVVSPLFGEVLGSTTFYDITPQQKRLEIGSTFFARKHWGSPVNAASKYLLLTYAFESWEMNRVALRCDSRNARSMAAIEKLGATREGVMRGHRIASDGSRGDSVYYSIVIEEWPQVKANLEARLNESLTKLSSQR